jgi:hypothetical protein|tara:strand:+ start:303 stop:500 length:198 start_codon:yes stop_codon:yes gene_type:complete
MKVSEALEQLGNIGITDLAKRLDVSRQAVWYWKLNGLPKLRMYEIREMIENDSKGRDTSEIQQGI